MLNRAKEFHNDIHTEAGHLENMSDGISQVWLNIMIIMTALIGIWGFVCLFSGIIGSESIVSVFEGYMTAITGSYF